MAERRLLREWYAMPTNSKMILESQEQNGGKIVLSGIIQKADTPNQNKRIYPMKLLQREVANYQKAIGENRALGCMDHPDSATISLKEVSHVMREVWMEGNNVMGRLEVLSTHCGKELEALIRDGITIGISSRGVGSTRQTNEGLDEVTEDFNLITFDVVSEPSTPGAFLSEGRIYGSNEIFITKPDRIFRALNDILMRKADKNED